MAEEQILTILIVFALCLNVLGFIFFVLSLKGEKETVPIPTKYEKDYDLPMNEPYLDEREAPYQFKKLEDEYDEDYRQAVTKEVDEHIEYEPNAPLAPAKEIASIPERIYTPEPIEEEYNPYQYQPTETYQPVHEAKEKENEEAIEDVNPYPFSYEPTYMTEEELDGHVPTNENTENTLPRPAMFQLDLSKEVDYKDEIRATDEDTLENQPTFEGDYQFKHAYSKEERYKYEYDDYKGYKVKDEDTEEAFDYTIDIDKEHEKYYGSQEHVGTNRYDLYLEKGKEEKEEDDLLAKARKPRPSHEDSGRQMFQSVDLNHVPETPLDREEREAEETIDIKQFEPKKYENQELFAPVEQKAPDEFDDEEVDRRIEYLMGKMHDPFQGKKKKDPLDEEF